MRCFYIHFYCIDHMICVSHRVKDKDTGFALRGDKEAEQSLVTLTVMVQVDVSHAACKAYRKTPLVTLVNQVRKNQRSIRLPHVMLPGSR